MAARLLSLVLPKNANWRYLKKGRKGLGFEEGVLSTRVTGSDYSVGVNAPIPGEVTSDSTNTVAITKRVNYLTHSAGGVTATLPLVAGDLREVFIIKNGANDVTVNINGGDSGNIILSAAAAASNTDTVATATTARYLSDGTSWYRVQ